MTDAIELSRLGELESVIDAGLKTFVDVGNALLEIRDSRLYREGWGTFEEYCQDRWGWQRNYANKMISAATVVNNLGTIVPISPATESQVRPLTSLPPEAQRQAWQTAVETAPGGKVTASHVQKTVDEMTGRTVATAIIPVPRRDDLEDEEEYFGGMGDDVRPHSVTITDEWGSVETIGIEPDEEIAVVKKTPLPLTASNHAISATPGYDGDEWFTPAEYIEAARDVMGSIDLDPASTSEAQKVVGAVRFFSKDDNGLMQTWNGNVFLNPPYSVPLIQEFVEKVMFEFDAGNIAQAIVLTNNSSDTKWFHSLLSRFPACFTRGRVQFWRPNLETFGTRQGQTFFYIGPNVNRFRAVFSEFGIVVSV